MNPIVLSHLQLREIFHLEFLRRLGGKLDAKMFAVKGGANLRFFFRSIRYSEDLDLDVRALAVERLKDIVLGILRSPAFGDHLKPFGIEEARLPDITRAKQTETTQRFKIHLLTKPGEDLFTKIEFSRRGFQGTAAVEAVADPILRFYKIPPLWAPHYDLESTIVQKVEALASRTAVQARDIFDLHLLIPQGNRRHVPIARLEIEKLRAARERIFEVDFDRFRDTVLAYLSPDDQKGYDAADIWDGVRMQVADFLEARAKSHA